MDFLDDYIAKNMKDPEFKKEWERSELEHTIARNVLLRRKKMGLSQNQVASRMKTKQSVISRIETGHQNTTIKTLKAVASALDTDVHSLVSQNIEVPKKLKMVRN